MSSEIQNSSKAKPSWLTRKVSFYIGLGFGGLLGITLLATVGFFYLFLSQDSISVKNGQVSLNKQVVTNTDVNNTNKSTSIANSDVENTSKSADITTTTNLNPQGERNAVATNGAVSATGENSNVSRDRANSPTITGNNNNITIVANKDLPGFSEKAYLVTPPSDINKYSQVNDLQPDALVRSASDDDKIRFGKAEIVIGGNILSSFFDINEYANESRFVFKLDGTQKAALLQFGLPDLSSGSTSQGAYIVKISSDGQPLWAGECKRSQGNQIFSVPLDISGKKSLTIEVTSNRKNESRLFFTKASVLKN
ncbi:MAG: hypothetical protein DCE90_08150 [Pseudanabaena sp.]|nr:MAG: hypothetical protein DCE90_08150 [Pseudanabaena sp.]